MLHLQRMLHSMAQVRLAARLPDQRHRLAGNAIWGVPLAFQAIADDEIEEAGDAASGGPISRLHDEGNAIRHEVADSHAVWIHTNGGGVPKHGWPRSRKSTSSSARAKVHTAIGFG